MMIQRWQSVWMLLCAVCMGVYSFTPFAEGEGPVDFMMYPGVLVLNLLVTLIFVVDIFLYRDLRRQMLVARVGIVLTACAFVIAGVVGWDYRLLWLGGMSLPMAAVVFGILGLRGMRADYRLLRSYDRLR